MTPSGNDGQSSPRKNVVGTHTQKGSYVKNPRLMQATHIYTSECKVPKNSKER